MICSILFATFINITGGVYYDEDHRVETCAAVMSEAKRQGVDPKLAVAVAWSESRWYATVTNKRSGAKGPLQILPRYWCPSADGVWRIHELGVSKCNYLKGGVRALKYYTTHRKTLRGAIASFGYKPLDHPYVDEIIKLHRGAKSARTP